MLGVPHCVTLTLWSIYVSLAVFKMLGFNGHMFLWSAACHVSERVLISCFSVFILTPVELFSHELCDSRNLSAALTSVYSRLRMHRPTNKLLRSLSSTLCAAGPTVLWGHSSFNLALTTRADPSLYLL